jgi:GH15 family glucan-1,4-alpha-glucosidase
MMQVIPKAELLQLVKRFLADPNRAMSIDLFAELAGLSKNTIVNVFQNETHPMTEITQRRVSKAYKSVVNGEVIVMQNKDKTRFIQYRKEPQLRLVKSNRISLVNGNLKVQFGVVNRNDYSRQNLDEQLRRK